MKITTPLMRLRDPDHTRVILVTLAETTPVLEALRLQGDLQRAGITPWAWIINNSLAAAAPTTPYYNSAQPTNGSRSRRSNRRPPTVTPSSRCSPKNPSGSRRYRI